jgi:Uma2 family endonuclease
MRSAFARQGAGHAWLIDPDARTLEVQALHAGHWLLRQALKDDDEVRVPPFDAVAFSLAAL